MHFQKKNKIIIAPVRQSSDSDVECGALFGQIRPYQLEPYAARRPEGEEVAAGVDVVRVGNTDW